MALVAFSSVSMGNTIEVEEEKAVDCIAVAVAALDAADPNNQWTTSQSNAFYQGQLNACYKSTKQLTAN
ncbi:hypothetical protein WFZ85_06555 [Flavobacterium sp. j3]|uniref:Uncharacterized protein n=1 Tax=Flavobacterium aureirubrum TaxID=3133147 RepID=A0ABU9N6U8_9FLAO